MKYKFLKIIALAILIIVPFFFGSSKANAYSGSAYYSEYNTQPGGSYSFSVTGGPANKSGTLVVESNGNATTSNWLTTDASGYAAKGPWTCTTSKTDVIHITWPDGSQTNSATHSCVPSGSLSPSAYSCNINSIYDTCNVNLSWSITNPAATPTAITANGMSDINVTNTMASPQSGTQSVSVPYGGRTFYLYNNGMQLASTTVSAVLNSCNSGPSGYTKCTDEGGTCSFSGNANVAFGCNSSFYYKGANSSTACSSANFGGDPLGGYLKACFYKPITISVSATTPYTTTPNTNVSFTYTPTTNVGATECRLLDNNLTPLTPYQSSSPIVWPSPSGESGTLYPYYYSYYVQCRNTTLTSVTATSNIISVNTTCGTGKHWLGGVCVNINTQANFSELNTPIGGTYSFTVTNGPSSTRGDLIKASNNQVLSQDWADTNSNGYALGGSWTCTVPKTDQIYIKFWPTGETTSTATHNCVAVPTTVSVSATTPYTTTPNTNVSFAYTATTDVGTTECRLLDDNNNSLTGYQAGSPIVYHSISGETGTVSNFTGYHVQCRNTTNNSITATSNQIRVYTTCPATQRWNVNVCTNIVAAYSQANTPIGGTYTFNVTNGIPNTTGDLVNNGNTSPGWIGIGADGTGQNGPWTCTIPKTDTSYIKWVPYSKTTNTVTHTCGSSVIVTPSVGSGGTISPNVPQTVDYNTSTSFTITPSATATVGGTCPSGSFAGNVYTTGTITSNCTVSVTFMSGTLSPATPYCSISQGQNNCSVNLAWGVTNPVVTLSAVAASGMTNVEVSGSNNQNFPVPYGGRTFFLYNNTILLAQSDATANCVSGTYWNGSTCAPVVNGGWSDWSSCSAQTCGCAGVQTRTCTNPVPNGGADCVGPSSQSCNAVACPSGTLSATSCTIPGGASTCTSTATWTTANLTSGTTEVTRNNPNGTHVSYNANSGGGGQGSTVNYGPTSFFLYHSISGTPAVLAYANINAACASGSKWDGSKCKTTASMSGTLTPASSSCIIPLNASNCSVSISWNTLNNDPANISAVTANGMTPNVDGNSGNQVFVVPYSSRTFYLYNNAIELARSSITASCGTGTYWSGTQCISVPACVVLPPTTCQDSTALNQGDLLPCRYNCTGQAGCVILTATPQTIPIGGSSYLNWSGSGTCTSTGFSTGGKTAGSLKVSPEVTTPYTFTCDGKPVQTIITVNKKPTFIEH